MCLLAFQDPPKEKKQAKVKPMSASEERMVDTAMARARELTSHLIGGSTQSPPVSPSQLEKSSFFEEDAGIISRLKNSIKRSGSPKSDHKRTFSEELGHKGNLDDEVTPEAQQAYNMLVVKGSFKDKSSSSSQQHPVARDLSHKDISNLRRSTSRSSSRSPQDFEPSEWSEPDLIRDSRNSSSPAKFSSAVPVLPPPSPTVICSLSPPVMSARPLVSPPQPPSKPVGVSQPKLASSPTPIPVPAPRPVKADSTKKSELPVPRPRPEIQRVEPTIRHTAPVSPDIPPKSEKRIESHFLVPASKEREELKKTIEIIRVDDSGNIQDDASEKASASFDRSSTRSSQRSSLDHSDNVSETADTEHADWEHSGCSSDSSRPSKDTDFRTSLSVDRKDSFSKKQTSSLFEEDLSSPSPQEIMSRLRERRLNRHMDHQRALSGEGDAASTVTASRPRTSVREPQGIPGRSTGLDAEDGAGGEGSSDEVDTNPLRMLRGGAIPIRTTGRGSAGTGIHGNRGALALRVPRLNFCRDLSRSASGEQKTETKMAVSSSFDHSVAEGRESTDGKRAATVEQTSASECGPEDCVSVTERANELGKPSNSLTQVQEDSTTVAKDDQAATDSKDNPPSDLSVFQMPDLQSSLLAHYVNSDRLSRETSARADGSLEISGNAQRSEGDNLTPPRLPPRRSQSLNENSEKDDTHLSLPPSSLRRSCSVNESKETEAPELPPREPHSARTPLNARPRERKFPLQINLTPQHQKQSSTSPQLGNLTTSAPKQIAHVKAHVNISPISNTSLTPSQHLPSEVTSSWQVPSSHAPHQSSIIHSPKSPIYNLSNRRPPVQHSCLMSRSLDSSCTNRYLHHHSSSVDLPPAYDLSVKQSVTSDVADSEPTHMLLDPHTPHLPFPLSVNLPSSADMTFDEPTHVSLSSLSDNKHSWSSTFTSPSPLSLSFHHRHHVSSSTSENCSSPGRLRTFDRSLSHDTRVPHVRIHNLYPDFSDNQSPPADLPPAPPTPSYREKLGLEQPRPKVSRSLSHNPNSHHSGSHSLTAESSFSIPVGYRGRSASTNSPSSRGHLTSPSYSSTQNVFQFPHNSQDIDDDDDAFFGEAPSYPHPYSQSPFRPVAIPHPNDLLRSSSVYSTVTALRPPNDISPYQISSPVSVNHSPRTSSSLPSSQLDTVLSPHTRRNVGSQSPSSHKKAQNHPSQPLAPHVHLTHTSEPVSLLSPHSTTLSPHSATLAPKPGSRVLQENCVANAASSFGSRTSAKASLSNQSLMPAKSDTSQQSIASHIFQFPSSGTTNNSFSMPPSSYTAAAAQLGAHKKRTGSPDVSPTLDYPSSSEVSPLMFASYSAASSVSYEDLRQFALDR